MSRPRPFRRVYGRWMVLPPARSRFVEIREGRGCVFFNICIRCSGFRKYSGYTVPLAHFNIIDRDRLRRPPSFPLLPEISRIRPLAPQLISPFSNPWLYRPGLRKGAPRRCRRARSGGPIHAHALRMLPLSPTVRPPMSPHLRRRCWLCRRRQRLAAHAPTPVARGGRRHQAPQLASHGPAKDGFEVSCGFRKRAQEKVPFSEAISSRLWCSSWLLVFFTGADVLRVCYCMCRGMAMTTTRQPDLTDWELNLA